MRWTGKRKICPGNDVRVSFLVFVCITVLSACATPVEQACEGKTNVGAMLILGPTPLLVEALSGPDTKTANCVMASTRNREEALEVARRLRGADGWPKRPRVALKIYERLVVSTGGTMYVYSPGFNGKPGTVIPMNSGPVVPGDRAAMRELGKMLILGEAGKPKLKHGWTWIRQAAEAGDSEAQALLKNAPGV
jgi:hypothetical protein